MASSMSGVWTTQRRSSTPTWLAASPTPWHSVMVSTHIGGQLLVLRGNLGNLPRLPEQDRIRHKPDGQYSHRKPLLYGRAAR